MQDRVPLYPGRVTLTLVAGQENTFDMARADQPTQEGTPLNKATLLKDTTAAKFGKDTGAVPDDVLDVLSKSILADGGNLVDVLGNMVDIPLKQIAGAASIEIGTYTGTGATTLTLKTNGKPKIMLLCEEIFGESHYPHCLIALLPDDLNNNVLYLPAIRFKGNNGATLEGAPVELTALSNDTLKIETSGLQKAQDIFNRSGTLYRFYFLFKEG